MITTSDVRSLRFQTQISSSACGRFLEKKQKQQISVKRKYVQ